MNDTETKITHKRFLRELKIGSEWMVYHERFGVMTRRPEWRKITSKRDGQIDMESGDGPRWMPIYQGNEYILLGDGTLEIYYPEDGSMSAFRPCGREGRA